MINAKEKAALMEHPRSFLQFKEEIAVEERNIE